jgi:hypothetical protein
MSQASRPDPSEMAELRQRVAWLEWQLWQAQNSPNGGRAWPPPQGTAAVRARGFSATRLAAALAPRWAGVIVGPLGWLSLPAGRLRLAAVVAAAGVLFVFGVAGSWRRRGFLGGLWRTVAAALLVSLAAELGLRLGSDRPWAGLWAVWAMALAALALDALTSARGRT